MKEARIISWEDRQDIIDVIQTRSSMMMSSRDLSPGFIDYSINRLDVYDHSLVAGIYEDGILDAFQYIHIWSNIRTYSTMIYTRKRAGREKYENGYDINLTLSYNFTIKIMEERGYFNCYHIYNDSPEYKPHYLNPHNKYNIYRNHIIEKVPAGQLPAVPIRQYLMMSPVDVDTQVVFRSLSNDLRDKPFDTIKFPIN